MIICSAFLRCRNKGIMSWSLMLLAKGLMIIIEFVVVGSDN